MPRVVRQQDLSAQQPQSPNITAYSGQEKLCITGNATADGVSGSFEATGRPARWLAQPVAAALTVGVGCLPAAGVVYAGHFLDLNKYVTMALAMITLVGVIAVLLRLGKSRYGALAVEDDGSRQTIVLEMTNETAVVETVDETAVQELPHATEGDSKRE